MDVLRGVIVSIVTLLLLQPSPAAAQDTDARDSKGAAITDGGQVQIYESMMADSGGGVTTGLQRATQFVKDNRLLPRGFDKASASPEVALHGAARSDEDFASGGDRVRYVIATGNSSGPYDVAVEWWYQPIGFRWARNLAAYNAPEPRRFVTYYDSMATGSAVVVAKAALKVEK